MKYLLIFSIFCASVVSGQKYVLIDKNMYLPIGYSNIVTPTDVHKNMFAVEKLKIKEFINALNKIIGQLESNTPDGFEYNIGATKFYGIKVKSGNEDRLDVVISTNCEGQKLSMHLSDGQVSNSSNAYFVKTWAGYIKENLK